MVTENGSETGENFIAKPSKNERALAKRYAQLSWIFIKIWMQLR